MYSLVFLALLALTAAAPAPRNYRYRDNDDYSAYFKDDFFDTHRFWREFQHEMRDLLDEVKKTYHSGTRQEGYVGNVYKVVIKLRNFKEEDIIVKAKKGLLVVQATKRNKSGLGDNFLDVGPLPDNVHEAGKWEYENGQLTIEFPIIGTPPESKHEKDSDSDSESNESLEIDVRKKNLGIKKTSYTHAVNEKNSELYPIPY